MFQVYDFTHVDVWLMQLKLSKYNGLKAYDIGFYHICIIIICRNEEKIINYMHIYIPFQTLLQKISLYSKDHFNLDGPYSK